MNVLAVIPARYASSRFPGKPLAIIAGKSMIQRVYEQVSRAEHVQRVVVATDDERIFQHVQAFGGSVEMTAEEHASGTDRCLEVAGRHHDFDLLLNVQGDEPFIDPAQIDELVTGFSNSAALIGTMVKAIEQPTSLDNPNVVKVVRATNGQALYFSRQAIPFQRDLSPEEWLKNHTYFRHLGIYIFKKEALETIQKMLPSDLEYAERLEQLRWLEGGLSIQTVLTNYETIGIDTPEDLEHANAQFLE